MIDSAAQTNEKVEGKRGQNKKAMYNKSRFSSSAPQSPVPDPQSPDAFKLEKPIKYFLVVCAVLLSVELLWMFVVSPCMPLSNITVKTAAGLSRQDVLRLAGISSRSSYASVRELQIEKTLMALPEVSSARVAKHFPDSVEIFLEGRAPAAVSLIPVNQQVIPVLFDAGGIIYQCGKGDTEIDPSLPIISGLLSGTVREGDRLDDAFLSLIAHLDILNKKAPELLAAISEIVVNKKAYDGFDLILYPAFTQVKIRLGEDLSEDTLRYMLLLLDVFEDKGVAVDEIDFRTGTAAYKMRAE
jgi:cell division protein FtsQ